MLQIFEKHQQTNNVRNYQSRIVKFNDFREYLRSINEQSLPLSDKVKIGEKHVDFKNQTITFTFQHNIIGDEWTEFIHFAQVIK